MLLGPQLFNQNNFQKHTLQTARINQLGAPGLPDKTPCTQVLLKSNLSQNPKNRTESLLLPSNIPKRERAEGGRMEQGKAIIQQQKQQGPPSAEDVCQVLGGDKARDEWRVSWEILPAA